MEKFTFNNCTTEYGAIEKEFGVITEELISEDIYPVDVVRVDNQVHITLNKSYRGSDKMITEIDFSAVAKDADLNTALQQMRLRLAYGQSQFDLNFTEGQALQGAKEDPRDFPRKQEIMEKIHDFFTSIVTDECMKARA